MINLDELKEWCKGGRRQVDIILGGPISPEYESIHVYDIDMQIGQDIRSAKDIDLIGKKKRQIAALEKKIERLREEVERVEHIPETNRSAERSPVSTEGE